MNGQALANIDDAAAQWVARMDADDWSEIDEVELQQWLREDPRWQGALLRAQAMWVAIDRAQDAIEIPEQHTAPKVPIFRRRSVLAGGLTALAASLALVMLPSGGNVYDTQVGEIRQVPLTDGSSAAINTASEIAVDMKPDVRLVRLEKGEAWFKVAKNKKRPFVVQAGDVWVRAVGTAFSVRRREGGADVLVTEGVVSAWSGRNAAQETLIHAGSQAFVSSNQHRVLPAADAASIDRQLAWRTGKIDLVDQPLSNAVAEFNRYNNRKIVLLDDTVAGEKVDGVFRTDDPEGFAVAVHNLLGVPLDARDQRTIRLGRENNRAAM
jgi:transmembrane sensor